MVEPFVTRARRYKPDELSRFLNEHYLFRFNLLTEMTEFRSVQNPTVEFALLDDRKMNTICIEAFNSGLCCRDRDVKRYVRSTYIEAYHPFRLYLDSLPEWDGTDRITDLARRVSSTSYWKDCFHRWMLALTAQWLGLNQGIHANSTAPYLSVPNRAGTNLRSANPLFRLLCRLIIPTSLICRKDIPPK